VAAWKHLGILAGLGLVFFLPLLAHPGSILYSDHSDFLTETLPAKHFLVRSWQRTGELPLWCPYSYGGMPFIHDVKVAVFYPPHLPLLSLPESWLGPVLSGLVVLHVIAAGFCMYAYARDQGLGGTASLVAGLGCMFAGKWLLHVLSGGHYVLTPLAWIPLVLLALERAIRHGSTLWATLAGVAFALVVLGGHPQATVYAGLFIGLWTLGPALGTWKRVALWLGLGLWTAVVAAALSAVALLPAVEGMTQATRGEGVGSAAGLGLTLNVLFDLFGVPVTGPSWEASGGLGVLWVAVAAVAPWVGPRGTGFRAAVAVAVLVFGLGAGALLQAVPGLSLFQIYPRMLLMLSVPVSLLAGVTTQALLDGRLRAARARRALLIVLLLAAALAGTRVLLADRRELHFSAYWPTLLLTVPVALWLVGTRPRTALAVLWTLVLLLDLWALASPLVAVSTEEYVHDPSASVGFVAAPALRAEHFRVLDRGLGEPSRSPLDPALPLLLEVESLRGYNSVDVRRYKDYLQLITGDDRPVRPREGLFGFPILGNFPIENKPLLDLLGTRYLIQPEEMPRGRGRIPPGEPGADAAWVEVFRDGRPEAYLVIVGGVQALPPFRVWENRTAFPRAFVVPEAAPLPQRDVLAALKANDFRRRVLVEGGGETQDEGGFRPTPIRKYQPNRVVIDLEGGPAGHLVLADVWYPGWQCSVDGEPVPVRRGNYLFRTVAVPAGAREAVFTFEPVSYAWGRAVSLAVLAALTLLGTAVVLGRLLRRRYDRPFAADGTG
jgi:hypothetical protein